jgi:hypothetical protein
MAFCCGKGLWDMFSRGCLKKSDRKIVKSAIYRSNDTIVSQSDEKPVENTVKKSRKKSKRTKSKKSVVVDEISSISVESQRIARRKEKKNMELKEDSDKDLTRKELGHVNEKLLHKNGAEADRKTAARDRRRDPEGPAHIGPKKAREGKDAKTTNLMELKLEKPPEGPEKKPKKKKLRLEASRKKRDRKPPKLQDKEKAEPLPEKAGEKPRKKIAFNDDENEILQKYKSSAYVYKSTHGQEHSAESSIDSEAEARGRQKSRRRGLGENIRKIEDVFRRDANEESESEISFIVDFYDRVDFNNNLKQKMCELLNQSKRTREAE